MNKKSQSIILLCFGVLIIISGFTILPTDLISGIACFIVGGAFIMLSRHKSKE